MVAMVDAVLFNCCTNHVAPDWAPFDWLEIGGCTTFIADDGSEITEGGQSDAEAEFWTVYAHLKEGGCEAITDCPTPQAAEQAAYRLSWLSGLPVR